MIEFYIFVLQDVKESLMIILKNILRNQINISHQCMESVSLRLGQKNIFDLEK